MYYVLQYTVLAKAIAAGSWCICFCCLCLTMGIVVAADDLFCILNPACTACMCAVSYCV